MHMADALLSPIVGISMSAVSAGAVALSAAKVKRDELADQKLPIMAVAGAFVFAAQMINFTIPGTGSSGHIGGGILLAAMLGSYPAMLAITTVLIIQSLIFADGGLLALGCNIFNMAVIPCLLIYPLIFKPLFGKARQLRRIGLAAVAASVVSLQLGAFAVVVETTLSGVTELPFGAFAALMQPIHLAIGLVEGLVTAAILTFVFRARPELIAAASSRSAIAGKIPLGKVLLSAAAITLITAGAISLVASSSPDGLEWAIGRLAGNDLTGPDGVVSRSLSALQNITAFLPDYDFAAGSASSGGGTSLAGVIGSVLTFALAGLAGFVIVTFKNKAKTRSGHE